MNILTRIKLNKLREIRKLKQKVPLSILQTRTFRLKRLIRPFKKAINNQKNEINLIAEIKPKSPSEGKLIEVSIAKTVRLYAKSRVDAISVLTDKKYFGGNLSSIKKVKNICPQPVLRKDFILDEYQVYESYLAGADAILLIAAILRQSELKKLAKLSKSLGLDCLVEIHDRADAKKALKAGAKIIGINNRDLKTMRVDLQTTAKLIKLIPQSTIVVSESGIKSAGDVKRLKKLGVKVILAGTSILKSKDPAKFIRSLRV